jgi:Tol biopolymer transport system component
VINADGTVEKNLTNHPSQDSNPQWSPDGGRIAFESLREGGNPEVFVMDADGSSPLNVSNDLKRDDGRPRWSPDGSRLVFVKVVGREPDVFLVNLADLNPVNLTNDADIDSAPEWSPDGTRIAYHSVKKRLMNVYVMTIGPNGTSTVNVTDDPIPAGTNTSGQDNFPLWSSDGSKILWTTTRHGPRQEIYVANADGSEPANLTQTPDIEEYGHSWSPDGKKVAFVRLVEGNSEIFVMNSDGTQVVRLTKNPANDVQPLWSPVASTR